MDTAEVEATSFGLRVNLGDHTPISIYVVLHSLMI